MATLTDHLLHASSWVMTVLLLPLTAAAAAELEPGLHRDLTASGPLVAARYHLFLPSAHAAQPAERLPLVLLASDPGSPDPTPFMDWAEANGVVLVSLGHPSAAEPAVLRPQVEAVLAELMAAYRIEPGLRFCFDSHGFVTDQISRTAGLEWAGFVACNFIGTAPLQKTACIGIVPAPPSAQNQSQRGFPGMLARMAGWGDPLLAAPMPSTAVGWNPATEGLALLDWMVAWQRLAQPALSVDARRCGQAWVVKRIAAVRAETDPRRRLDGARSLLQAAPVAKLAEAKPLAGVWAEAAFGLAIAEADPKRRARLLDELAANEWAKALDAPRRRELAKTLADLRKDPDVRADGESRAALADARTRVEAYHQGRLKGDEQKNLRQLIRQLEEIAKHWPGTDTARDAAAAIADLEKELR